MAQNPEHEGMKQGALANAIRERLHTLVDELSLTSPIQTDKAKIEIALLVQQFPVVL